jgi:hypothetical protein
MRDAGIIAVIIIAAVSIGGLLYIYGGAAFHPTPIPTTQRAPSNGDFTILAQGAVAAGVDQRANYRITDATQLNTLWQMIYSNNGSSEPVIDFSRQEVLAIFDGSHSATGYSIRVNSVKDNDGQRVIDITHTEPGSTCTPTGESSSPFEIILVQKTTLPLAHEEHTEVNECR